MTFEELMEKEFDSNKGGVEAVSLPQGVFCSSKSYVEEIKQEEVVNNIVSNENDEVGKGMMVLGKSTYLIWELVICVSNYFSFIYIGMDWYLALGSSTSMELLYTIANIMSGNKLRGNRDVNRLKWSLLILSTVAMAHLLYQKDPARIRFEEDRLKHYVSLISPLKKEQVKISKKDETLNENIRLAQEKVNMVLGYYNGYSEEKYLTKALNNKELKEMEKEAAKQLVAAMKESEDYNAVEKLKPVTREIAVLTYEMQNVSMRDRLANLSFATWLFMLIVAGIQYGYSLIVPKMYR
ncbi:hypothetical protein [Halobacteriovorax sp. ZH2_bin.1]|uniref:hypothetical protein n=1 Tax=unclassified Halobacteriovorax TaxID=2639665 RepID=UPI0037212517